MDAAEFDRRAAAILDDVDRQLQKMLGDANAALGPALRARALEDYCPRRQFNGDVSGHELLDLEQGLPEFCLKRFRWKRKAAESGNQGGGGARRHPWAVRHGVEVVDFVWRLSAADARSPVWSLLNIATRSFAPRIAGRNIDWPALAGKWNEEHPDQPYKPAALKASFYRASRDPDVSRAFFAAAEEEWRQALTLWYGRPVSEICEAARSDPEGTAHVMSWVHEAADVFGYDWIEPKGEKI